MYQEKVLIDSNEVDASLTLRLSSLFRIIQSVVMKHTEVLNVGTKETIDKGMLWVISRIRLEITRMPKYQEEIVCKTYPGKTILNMLFPRHFYIEDTKGNVIIRFSSIWALIDKENRHPVSSAIIASRCIAESHENELELPEKLEEKPAELKEKRKIHYSDVDLNSHLNNTKYIELFSDLHNSDFYKEYNVSSLTLNYLKEIKEGDIVEVYSNNNEKEFVIVKCNGQTSFLGSIEYRKL